MFIKIFAIAFLALFLGGAFLVPPNLQFWINDPLNHPIPANGKYHLLDFYVPSSIPKEKLPEIRFDQNDHDLIINKDIIPEQDILVDIQSLGHFQPSNGTQLLGPYQINYYFGVRFNGKVIPLKDGQKKLRIGNKIGIEKFKMQIPIKNLKLEKLHTSKSYPLEVVLMYDYHRTFNLFHSKQYEVLATQKILLTENEESHLVTEVLHSGKYLFCLEDPQKRYSQLQYVCQGSAKIFKKPLDKTFRLSLDNGEGTISNPIEPQFPFLPFKLGSKEHECSILGVELVGERIKMYGAEIVDNDVIPYPEEKIEGKNMVKNKPHITTRILSATYKPCVVVAGKTYSTEGLYESNLFADSVKVSLR